VAVAAPCQWSAPRRGCHGTVAAAARPAGGHLNLDSETTVGREFRANRPARRPGLAAVPVRRRRSAAARAFPGRRPGRAACRGCTGGAAQPGHRRPLAGAALCQAQCRPRLSHESKSESAGPAPGSHGELQVERGVTESRRPTASGMAATAAGGRQVVNSLRRRGHESEAVALASHGQSLAPQLWHH
jgi:hypothetical protein